MILGVTGAGGALGGAVVDLLAGRAPVVAITRHPSRLPQRDGVDIREGDFDRPETLTTAFAGIDRLLLVSTDAVTNDHRIAQHRAALDAAVAAGVRHVVYTSLVGADGPPELLNAAHAATEARLRTAGPAWTILRNNLYVEGLAAPGGVYVTNYGDGAVAYVSRADCAATAAEVLLGEGWEGRILEVSGPVALRYDDAARLIARRGGAPVEPRLLDDDEYRAHLAAHGYPDGLITALVTLGQAIRAGRYARPSSGPVSRTS